MTYCYLGPTVPPREGLPLLTEGTVVSEPFFLAFDAMFSPEEARILRPLFVPSVRLTGAKAELASGTGFLSERYRRAKKLLLEKN